MREHRTARSYWEDPPTPRPSLWPRNEPFPPEGGAWRRVRRRFLERMVGFALMAFAAFLLFVTLVVSVVIGVVNAVTGGAAPHPLWILAVILLILFFNFGARR